MFNNIIKQFATIVIVFQLSVTKGSETITTKFRLHFITSVIYSSCQKSMNWLTD